MNWLVLAGLLATGFVTPAQQAALPGTCASIGYSTVCCPPGGGTQCKSADGECYCSSDCHAFGDCCDDVHCISQPRTCADVGLTSCCNDVNGTGKCDVYFRDSQNNHCSCNNSCHQRNDCCSDAVNIGCRPETCTLDGKDPGCCMWSNTHACFVLGGACYCDSYCNMYNDCCDDVPATNQCGSAQLSRSNTLRTMLDEELKASTIQRFNENDRRTQRIQNANARSSYRKERILSSQRQHMNAREFRGRQRIAG